MGGGGNSGGKALGKTADGQSPKRPSTSGIYYARELNQNDNTENLKNLRKELLKDINSYDKNKKVPEHTSMYRILYKDGKEIIIRYMDGKEIILNSDGKRLNGLPLTGMVYISKANGNQEFIDSLGFKSTSERGAKIFESKQRFGSYNKEVKRMFDPKVFKNATRTNGVFMKGDTPRNIDSRFEYRVNKLSTNGEMSDYGSYSGKDLKSILKGYHFNGLFWDKKGAKIFFTLSNPTKVNSDTNSKTSTTKKKKKKSTTAKKSSTKSTTKKSKVWEKGKKTFVNRK